MSRVVRVPKGEKIKNCCFSDSARKKYDNSNETNPRLVGSNFAEICTFKVGKTEK